MANKKSALRGELKPTTNISTSIDKVKDKIAQKDKANQEKVEAQANKEKQREAFTFDDLKKHWDNFIQELKRNDKSKMLQIMMETGSLHLEGEIIQLTLVNEMQTTSFETSKVEIVGYLRNKLQNDYINLTWKVAEQKDQAIKMYTQQDKFNHLIEKYPALLKLTEVFELDLDQ